ncbi:MAG: CotH kinase family protein [Halioglobus sp.]|nr:CotH kinase family protein [Halioglobus sp.]
MYRILSIFMMLALLMLAGCGVDGGTTVASNGDLRPAQPDTSDQLFQPNEIVHVDIKMNPDDYDILRNEGRNFATIVTGCAKEFEYSNFNATVTVNGEVLDDVDIRKKGFLGSLSAGRPSLKLNFDELRPGRRLYDLERMTLNNNLQDPSNTHTCMSYELFREAGVPAPRCNFARVSVNGKDLGTYSHVESIKKHFLRRNFDNDAGNLYEAQIADFGENLKENFQLKTNREINDRSDLSAVVSALSATDENLPGLLSQVVDLEAFILFWAMETVAGHWDGSTSNANNYLIYANPDNGRFYYIPWGTDAALEQDSVLDPGTGPLYRATQIPSRLYKIPEFKQKYDARVLELLGQLWNAESLNAEVDRIRDLTQTPEENMEQVRAFIRDYEGKIRAAVAGETQQIERTIPDRAIVCDRSGYMTLTGNIVNGRGTVEWVDLKGDLITVQVSAAPPAAGVGGDLPSSSVFISLSGLLDGSLVLFPVLIEKDEFGQLEVPLQGTTTMILRGTLGGAGSSGFQINGVTGAGLISFDEAPTLGGEVNMRFTAEFVDSRGLFGGGL